jgi:hypothetical protein
MSDLSGKVSMRLPSLKSVFILVVPAVILLGVLMLAGCIILEINDRVVLQPAQVSLVPGDKPVTVTATWTSNKEGGEFLRWEPPSGGELFSIDFGQTSSSPTSFLVGTSSAQPIFSQMHDSAGRTFTPCVGAVILRNGHEEYASNCLSIVIGFPRLLLTVSGAKTKISGNTRQFSATLDLEVINAPKGIDYKLEIIYLSGAITLGMPGGISIVEKAPKPSITGLPSGPATSARAVVSQTITIGGTDHVRKAIWNIMAIGTAETGSQVESQVERIQFTG